MARRRPTVSVLMPVLNADPEYLRQAVASVLAQSLRHFELLVVEDPSERDAGPRLAAFDDTRIRHLRNPQRTSFVAQLNRGLAEARGVFVARMDADDVAEPDRLARQHQYLAGHPGVAVLGSQVRIIDESGTVLGYRAYPTEHAAVVRALRRVNALAHPSVMFRSAVVRDAGGYACPELHPAEDYELWCRLAVRGVRFANLPEALLRYRVHRDSSKSRHTHATLRHTIAVKERYWRGRLGLGDRLRLWGERILLGLPDSVVLRLFRYLEYRHGQPLPAGERKSAA